MEVFLLMFVIISILICVYLRRQFRNRSYNIIKGKPLPGPKLLPVFGNTFQVDIRRLHLSVSDLVKDYGTIFQISLMGQNVVILNEARLVRKAYGSAEYGDVLNGRPASFFGKYVLFNCSDIGFANWNKKTITKRKMWHMAFKLYGSDTGHYEQVAEDEMKSLLDDIETTKGDDFDIYTHLKKSVANNVITFMTGAPPEAYDSNRLWQLIDFGNTVFEFGTTMVVYAVLPGIRFLPGYFGRLFRKAMDARDYILDRCYLPFKRPPTEAGEEDIEPGFINAFTKFQNENNMDESKDFMDDDDMKGIVLDVVIGGVTSVTITLTNLFALVMVHPNIAKRIQNEIDNVIGSARLPRLSDKDKMPYIMATI